VADLKDTFYIITCRYECPHCKHHFVPTTEEFLGSLPFEIQQEFPARLSHRSAVSWDVAQLLQMTSVEAVGPSKVRAWMEEFRCLTHSMNEAAYYSCIAQHLQSSGANSENVDM
jgi:hypothetical protein